DAERGGDAMRVYRTCATESDEREPARVLTALEHVEPCGRRHVLVDDVVDAPRRARQIEPERLADLRADRRLGGGAVELHAPAREVFGIDVAQNEIGVGDRRLDSALAVTRGSRARARASRPHAHEAEAVDGRDTAAARAD